MTQQNSEITARMTQHNDELSAKIGQLTELMTQRQAEVTENSEAVRGESSRIRMQKKRKLDDCGLLSTEEESGKDDDGNDPYDSENDCVPISFERRWNWRIEVEDRQVNICVSK